MSDIKEIVLETTIGEPAKTYPVEAGHNSSCDNAINNNASVNSHNVLNVNKYFAHETDAGKRILAYLYHYPDATTGEIAAGLNIDYEIVKALLTRLEREGYIKIILRRHYFAHRRINV